MNTKRIETSDVIDSMLEKYEDLKKRCAYYEKIHPDLPERYAKAQHEDSNQDSTEG